MSELPPQIEERIKDLLDLYEALKNDADGWWSVERDHPDENARRAAVRSTFAFVEGVTFALKQLVVAWLTEQQGLQPWRTLTTEEHGRLALLREDSYNLTDLGKVQIRPARLETSSNILFAFDSYFQIVNKTACPIDPRSEPWRNFRRALQVRHRLTHPKSRKDIVISAEEALFVNKAYVWFHGVYQRAFGR